MDKGRTRIFMAKRRSFALEQLRVLRDWLSGVHGGALRPGYVDAYPPVELSFEGTPARRWHEWLVFNSRAKVLEETKDNPAQSLSSTSDSWGELHFEQRAKGTTLEGSIENLPLEVPYRGRFQMSFDNSLLSDIPAISFCEEVTTLAAAISSDYGFVTAEDDYRLQNRLEAREAGGCIVRWVGENLSDGIPGFYWFNLWPIRAVRLLDCLNRERLREKLTIQVNSSHILIHRLRDICDLTSAEGVAELVELKGMIGQELFCRGATPQKVVRDPFP